MAVNDFGSRTYFSADEIVVSGSYARKILKRVYVDEVNDYRYVIQRGRITDNKFAGSANALSLQSFEELKQNFSGTWKPDVVAQFKKGDVFTSDKGEFFVIESEDGKAWRLNSGTWSTVRTDDSGNLTWDNIKLTMVKTIAGGRFSQYLGK